VVLFGGATESGFSGETWEWDGRAWARMDTAPQTPRAKPAFVYDAGRRLCLLYGGAAEGFRLLGDMLGWDGRTWRSLD
jgi:hypothetical protein